MSAIDPALLQAQWLQYQQSQLSKSATIPQYQQPVQQYQQPVQQYQQPVQQYQQPVQQYAPQQTGEYVSAETIATITQFVQAANKAASDANQYINYLQSELTLVDQGFYDLVQFSGRQEELIEKFLFDRNFALQYARYSWQLNPITNEFASDLADAYIELAKNSPFEQAKRNNQNPAYTGNPNIQFSAQVIPQAPIQQNSIPPLPGNSGAGNQSITMEQYLAAQANGQVGAARAAAMQNSANIYASLFQ